MNMTRSTMMRRLRVLPARAGAFRPSSHRRWLSYETSDVTIIGAGVIGSSLAHSLAHRGFRVLVVDALRGAGQGSTSYSSGVCRQFYSVLDAVKIAYEGYHYWRDWDDHIGLPRSYETARLRQCGGLLLQSPATDDFLSKVLPLFDEVGIVYDTLDRQTVESKFGPNSRFGWDLTCFSPPRRVDDPRFGEPSKTESVRGAVFVPETGYIADPQLATVNLQRAAEGTGRVQYCFGSKVVDIDKNAAGDTVRGVTLEDGTHVSSPIVVNAAGPYSSVITALAFKGASVVNDMTMTTRPMRQEVAYVPSPPGADYGCEESPGPVLSDIDTGVYLRPEVGNKILIGSMEPACDTPIYLERPEDMNASLTEEHTNLMYRAALRMPHLRLPGAANAQGIVACYDVTEDWTPIYDKSAILGYYMAIGTSGNQFKNAPVVGEMMAEIMVACERHRYREAGAEDHDVRPYRYQLRRQPRGGTVNTGTFSRKRERLRTSNSVLG